jgi:hypothetical protein
MSGARVAAAVVMSRSVPASVPDGNISPYLAGVCSADLALGDADR